MSCDSHEQAEQCCREFAAIQHKLDQLDQAIRGNGTPGINVRLDRLERIEASRGRLTWIVTGAFASAGVGVLLQLLALITR